MGSFVTSYSNDGPAKTSAIRRTETDDSTTVSDAELRNSLSEDTTKIDSWLGWWNLSDGIHDNGNHGNGSDGSESRNFDLMSATAGRPLLRSDEDLKREQELGKEAARQPVY